jgi:hypothetical protein
VATAHNVPAGSATAPWRTDLHFARALLGLALAVAAIYGSGVARHVPVYGPFDEFFHTAFVQKIADSGEPPLMGRDGLVLGLGQKRPGPTFTIIRGLDHPYVPALGRHVTPVFPDGTTFAQNEAIQPPLYYFVMAPVAVLVNWSQRVLVMRLLGTAFVMLSVYLLYRGVREVSPHRPLAAGVAAAILGSMGGIVSSLSQVQNDALLMPLCVATFWLLARDLRRRRAGLLLPLIGGASIVTQFVAGPAAVVVTLAALRGDERLRDAGWRTREGVRVIATRLAAFGAFIVPDVIYNLIVYHWFWPIAVSSGAGGAPAARNWALARHFVEQVFDSGDKLFTGFWLQLWPLRDNAAPPDPRAATVIAVVAAVSLIIALCTGELVRERLRLGYWAAAAAISFFGVYVVLFASAASSGGYPDFVGRYFVAFAAAYAGFVGTAVACVAVTRPWIARGFASAVALVLCWQMLDLAYPWVVG